MLSQLHPTVCRHDPLKLHSAFYGNMVLTKAKCLECGTNIKVQFPVKVINTDTGLAPLAEIEHRVKVLMRKAILHRVEKNRVLDVKRVLA